VKRALTLFAMIGVVAWPSGARAHPSDRSACIDGFESAQKLRAARALVEEREKLVACVQPTCPAPIVRDCSAWLAEVDASMPSIVLGAVDARGRDIDDVSVSLDGRPLRERLDGKAIDVDPGPHTLRYARKGATSIDYRVVIQEGEKNRLVRVVFPDPAVALAPSPEAPAAGPTVPIATYLLGGLTLLAAGSFAYFGLRASGEASDARACEATLGCNNVSMRDEAMTHAHVADVSLAVGALALVATGLTFYFGRSHVAAPPLVAAPRTGER
jgi:hypothetical protein